MYPTNICLLSDSYKFGHFLQMPKGTETIYSYFESRNGAHWEETVFFGLQKILKDYFVGSVVTREKIDMAEKLAMAHFGQPLFNKDMWVHIVENHNGYLPIRIKAIPEGMAIPVSNVLMTVENIDPKCYALTNFMETVLTHVWYSCTVATLSRSIKKTIKGYLEKTDGDIKHLDFALHDFGYRGASSVESAAIGGMAHLVNFMGTDTVAAMECAIWHYRASLDDLAFSVPATEHSVMTSLGKDGEEELFAHLLDKHPRGILSVVIDSYNYQDFISVIAKKHKERILAREGKLVFRPDSGNPVEVTLDVLERLEEVFGSEYNSRGFKKLNDKVGALWGDGIGPEGIEKILEQMTINFWRADNIVFGMGGGLLQKVNRDIQRFAFKSSAQKRNGEWHDIYKDPIDKSKASKKGRLALINNEFGYRTVVEHTVNECENLLKTVFENGRLVQEITFNEVRRNAAL